MKKRRKQAKRKSARKLEIPINIQLSDEAVEQLKPSRAEASVQQLLTQPSGSLYLLEMGGPPIVAGRMLVKATCDHRRNIPPVSGGKPRLCISWAEHSNHIILGICGKCGSRFDARLPEDKLLFEEYEKYPVNNSKMMARAGSHSVTKIQVLPKSKTLWQKIKTYFFPSRESSNPHYW